MVNIVLSCDWNFLFLNQLVPIRIENLSSSWMFFKKISVKKNIKTFRYYPNKAIVTQIIKFQISKLTSPFGHRRQWSASSWSNHSPDTKRLPGDRCMFPGVRHSTRTKRWAFDSCRRWTESRPLGCTWFGWPNGRDLAAKVVSEKTNVAN